MIWTASASGCLRAMAILPGSPARQTRNVRAQDLVLGEAVKRADNQRCIVLLVVLFAEAQWVKSQCEGQQQLRVGERRKKPVEWLSAGQLQQRGARLACGRCEQR